MESKIQVLPSAEDDEGRTAGALGQQLRSGVEGGTGAERSGDGIGDEDFLCGAGGVGAGDGGDVVHHVGIVIFLSGYGIHTIGELAATSDDFLKCRLGKNGLAIKKYANGLDDSPVMRSDYVSPVKSIGHGITTMQDLENNAEVWCVMLELVQGEGGVVALEPEYVQAVRKLCDDRDLVLIVDEVQTGVGRTGTFLCCEHYNLKPDVVTLAKGLGGGLPIGAVLMNEKVAEGMGPGTHGSTFGGNPVVCAGANVVVDRMDNGFLANVNERAVQLRAGIAKLPHVKSISGIGLMVGIEFFDVQAADVLAACREKGLLVLTAKARLRLLPPLTVSEHEVDMALDVLAEVLGTMEPTAPKEQA